MTRCRIPGSSLPRHVFVDNEETHQNFGHHFERSLCNRQDGWLFLKDGFAIAGHHSTFVVDELGQIRDGKGQIAMLSTF